MVNDSSTVGPGKEKRTSGNADAAASSASLGGYSAFCWPACAPWPVLYRVQVLLGPGPLGRPRGQSMLMIFFWGASGLGSPKSFRDPSVCGGSLENLGGTETASGVAKQTPIALMMLSYWRLARG